MFLGDGFTLFEPICMGKTSIVQFQGTHAGFLEYAERCNILWVDTFFRFLLLPCVPTVFLQPFTCNRSHTSVCLRTHVHTYVTWTNAWIWQASYRMTWTCGVGASRCGSPSTRCICKEGYHSTGSCFGSWGITFFPYVVGDALLRVCVSSTDIVSIRYLLERILLIVELLFLSSVSTCVHTCACILPCVSIGAAWRMRMHRVRVKQLLLQWHFKVFCTRWSLFHGWDTHNKNFVLNVFGELCNLLVFMHADRMNHKWRCSTDARVFCSDASYGQV